MSDTLVFNVPPRIKLGDVFAIDLPDGRIGYVHVLYVHPKYGYLVQVLDRITREEISETDLTDTGGQFPPVFVDLIGGVKSGSWKKIGNLPIRDFVFPTFRLTVATKPGTYENWWLWSGAERRFIGKLPAEMRSLEVEQVWGYEILAERIATGRNYDENII